MLLCRVEDRRGLSHLCAARSANGVDGWQIDSQPTLLADPVHYPDELWGIEDPRITYVPELSQYAVIYTAYSHSGPGVALALTRDFRDFERYGVIMQPQQICGIGGDTKRSWRLGLEDGGMQIRSDFLLPPLKHRKAG